MNDNLNNEINDNDELQFNMLDDMGIGLNNTFMSGMSEEIIDELFVDDLFVDNSNQEVLQSNDGLEIQDEEKANLELEEKTETISGNEEIINEVTDETNVDEHEESNVDVFCEEENNLDAEEVSGEDKYVLDGEIQQSSNVIEHTFKDVTEEEEKESLLDENDDNEFMMDDIAPYISRNESSPVIPKRKRPKRYSTKKKLLRIGAIVAGVAIVLIGGFFITTNVIADKYFTDFSDTVAQEEQFDTKSVLSKNAEVVQANEFNWDMIKGNPTYDENIYNVLIVGGDIAGKKDVRGNSDTLIIVSIDKNTKKIKLSSIMRDTYVPIPGYSDNKINSAYATGGVPLIKQVIEENFKVTIDSTVVVNYSTFRKAIKLLGGVEDVVLNYSEANFINMQCRVRNHESNLTEGTYDLDAEQALHFARIRKISSDVYGKDDFGRTARQRFVINQLFKKYKDLSYAELARLITSVMGELEVDRALKDDLFLLLQVVLKFNVQNLEEFRLPMDDAYTFASVPVPGSYQNMSVVKIDDFWTQNVDALHMFIYGNTDY